VIVVLSIRLFAVLRKGGIPLPFSNALKIVWVGQFWNCFLPGSTGGDVYRLAALWSRYPQRKTDGFMGVLFDRLIGTAVLAVVAAVGLSVLPIPPLRVLWTGLATRRGFWITIVGIAVLVPLLGASIFRSFLSRFYARVMVALRDARIFLTPDRQLFGIIGWAVLGHFANFTVFFLYARSVGLSLTFAEVCLILPTVLILLMAPISINGHGVREVLLILFLAAAGIGPERTDLKLPESVLALSVVGLSSDFALGLLGGFVFLLSRGYRVERSTAASARI
jgi:hypothetical protein